MRLPPGQRWRYAALATVLFGAVGVLVVFTAIAAAQSWRYHHAPVCPTAGGAGCRSVVRASIVDIRSFTQGKYDRVYYELTTVDGLRFRLSDLPASWRASPDHPLDVTLDRFDGTVFAVSVGGTALRTESNPDGRLPLLVPAVPASAGIAWYLYDAAWRSRIAGLGRDRNPRLLWLRQIALAVTLAGAVAFIVALWAGASLTPVLATEALATVGAFLLIVRYARLRGTATDPEI